jgi:hypothetical protein
LTPPHPTSFSIRQQPDSFITNDDDDDDKDGVDDVVIHFPIFGSWCACLLVRAPERGIVSQLEQNFEKSTNHVKKRVSLELELERTLLLLCVSSMLSCYLLRDEVLERREELNFWLVIY